jgi:hypothetical protein
MESRTLGRWRAESLANIDPLNRTERPETLEPDQIPQPNRTPARIAENLKRPGFEQTFEKLKKITWKTAARNKQIA